MKTKVLAIICAFALVLGLTALVDPAAEAAETTMQAGYGVASIDPIDKAGTYRTIDYTAIYNGSGNASLKADIDAAAAAGNTALKMVKDAEGNVTSVTYTVQTLSVDCDGDGNKSDGYFSVPLAGYGGTNERMSTGKMDENGDGKITDADGNRITCTAVTDPEGETILFFTLDLISSADFAPAAIRAKITDALKAEDPSWYVPGVNMMFSASHTHSSPDTGIDNSYALPINAAQRAYEVLIVDRAIEAAKLAMADRVAVTMAHGEVEATNMNATRHYNITEQKAGKTSGTVVAKETWTYGDNFGGSMPSDTYVQNGTGSYTSGSYRYTLSASNVSESDETLYLVEFTPVSGSKTPIVLVNFRAHAKINSTATTQYGLDNRSCNSSDFAGPLREKLEKFGYRASYIQGASGNQNTFNYLDDSVLGAKASQSYSWLMQRHTTAIDNTTTNGCYNDRMSFISYKSPVTGKTANTQTGASYGCRLADYALEGLENMTQVASDSIKVNQTYFIGEDQMYSKGLIAAAIDYKEVQKKTSGAYEYYYTDPDKTDGDESGYYNINSVYHADAIYGRRDRKEGELDVKLELNCITVGKLAFVSAPNEMYDRYNDSGDQVNNNLWDAFNTAAVNAGYCTPVFLGYTNGSEGYIPNVAAYEYNRANNNKGSVTRPTSGTEMIMGVGAYEANTSKFAEGSGEDIIRHFQKTLLNMKNVSRPSTCPMCGATGVVWESIGEPKTTAINGGHYYLSDDLVYYYGSLAYQRTVYADSCIDLNGHIAGNSSDATGRSFQVMPNVTLRMMNGTVMGRGVASGGEGGVILMHDGAKLYLDNVDVIRENYEGQTSKHGGAIFTGKGCTLDIRNSSITGGIATGTADVNCSGGNLYIGENNTVVLKDTVISGGSAKRGGNMFMLSGGSLDMENVTMEGGSASTTGDNMLITSPTVHIYGNTVLKGGSVFSSGDHATTKFSGNVQAYASPSGENINLAVNTRLTFGELADTAKISVRGSAAITDTTAFAYVGKQLVTDEGYYMDTSYTTRGVFMGDKWMCECGGMVEESAYHTHEYHAYAPWGSATGLPTLGNYYLTRNVTVTAQQSPNDTYKTVRYDLNGYSLTHKLTAPGTTNGKPSNTRVYYVGGGELLVITDTVGSGFLTRDLSNLNETQKGLISESGLGVGVDSTGTFRLYSGTIDGSGQTSTGAGGVVTGMNKMSSIQIFGGTLKGITGATAGCIYANGPVLLAGGTLQGGKGSASHGMGGVYMSTDYTTAVLTLTGNTSVTGNYRSNGTTAGNILCDASRFVIAGNYTGTAGITVSSPTMGKVIGVSDKADITNATLTVDDQDLYQIVTSGTQLKLTSSANAVVRQEIGTDVEYYTSVEAAIAAYQGSNAVLVLMQDINSTVVLTKNLTLDLAGHSVRNVDCGSYKLTVKDSATDDFTVEDADGYGTLPENANITAGKDYVKIVEDGKASFHRLDLSLSTLSWRAAEAGLYYGGRFGGDEIIKTHISEFGVSLRVNTAPDEVYIRADTEKKTHWGYDADQWVVNNGDNAMNGVILKGIMKPDNGYAFNKRNAEAQVYGVSYVILDGQLILGESAGYSLHRFFEIFDERCYHKATDDQKRAIQEMYAIYEKVMRAWNIPNIKAEILK